MRRGPAAAKNEGKSTRKSKNARYSAVVKGKM